VLLSSAWIGGSRGARSDAEGISLEEASAVLKSVKKAGIATYVYLLFGTPPEERKRHERPWNLLLPTMKTLIS